MRITQKEIARLEKATAIHARIEALEFTGVESKSRASLWRFLLTVGALSDKGMKLAEEWVQIMEKYNDRKTAA